MKEGYKYKSSLFCIIFILSDLFFINIKGQSSRQRKQLHVESKRKLSWNMMACKRKSWYSSCLWIKLLLAFLKYWVNTGWRSPAGSSHRWETVKYSWRAEVRTSWASDKKLTPEYVVNFPIFPLSKKINSPNDIPILLPNLVIQYCSHCQTIGIMEIFLVCNHHPSCYLLY